MPKKNVSNNLILMQNLHADEMTLGELIKVRPINANTFRGRMVSKRNITVFDP